MHPDLPLQYLALACVFAIAGAVFDIRTRKIPNRLVTLAVVLGLSLHTIWQGWHGLAESMGALLFAGGIFFVFYLLGGMGAGDVKLMAGVAAIAGVSSTPYLLVLTALAGGLMALALATIRGRMRESMSNVVTLTAHHMSQGMSPHPELNVRNATMLRLPYGVAIAIGCTLTFFMNEVKA